MSAIEIKICALPQCNRQFPSTNKRRKYCSPECGKEADRQLSRERYKKRKAKNEILDSRNVTPIEIPQTTTASPLYLRDLIGAAFIDTQNRITAVESALLELLSFFPIHTQNPEEPRLKRAILLTKACGNDLAIYQTCKILQKILHISQREAQDLLILAAKFIRETENPAQKTLGDYIHGG